MATTMIRLKPLLGPILPLCCFGSLGAVEHARHPSFVEVARESGLIFQHRNFATDQKFLPETMGAGAGFLDYDNDGWLDVYLLNGAPLRGDQKPPVNRLFRNRGDGTFQDVTKRAGVGDPGYGMGLAAGDFDNDGWTDLYVTNFGPNVLYRNRGDGTFEHVTEKAGVGDERWSSSAGFFDYDRDGDLDLYVVNYLEFTLETNIECKDYEMKERSYCHPHHFRGAADRLYQNQGDGTFRDVSTQAGVDNGEGKGLGVVLTDLDLDGWIDIYVANDSVGNFLYRNLGNGRFEDLSLVSATGYSSDGRSEAGMGTDAADVDGDGLADLFVTNLDYETNTLYRNRGRSFFEDETARRGLSDPGWLRVGFGTRFFDYDNDGDPDLFVANGHILDNVAQSRPWLSYPQPNQLYRNSGGVFEDISESSGPGLALAAVSRGTAVGDYDNDGDIDLLVTNCNGPVHLLRNEGGNSRNWLLLQFQGTRSNRDGVGVRVEVRSGGSQSTASYEKVGGSSYLSAHDPRLHIGLGDPQKVDLKIHWPSGAVQSFDDVEANQILKIRE